MDKQIAIQVGAVSFVDEGIDNVLDNLQKLANVDTIFLANFTYTRGTGGRQVPWYPFPDHGKEEYDYNFVGGNYGNAHPQYYRNTFIKPEDFKAKEHEDIDIMAEVIPVAKQRNMKVYAWIEESSGLAQAETIPNYGHVLEQDAIGRKGKRPCFNNPDYRNWHLGFVEDCVKSYNIDGLAWASERQGPLGNLLLTGGPWASESQPTCFCDHCTKKAKEQGINVDRAREGYLKLQEFIVNARNDIRPVDGYFVTFWRLLIQYPEIFAWEKLWHQGQRQFYKEIYGLVKAIRPEVQVGWHVFHLNSFSPFYRATQDLKEMSYYSDFIKLVAYNNCAGPRFADYMENLHSTIFRDASPEETLMFVYRMLGIEEGDLSEIPKTGWSADFVRRETERALAAVNETNNGTHILPGIDVDIPLGPEVSCYENLDGIKMTEPEDVYQAVTASLTAGAQGIVLSRKYSEMKLENLKACGKAIKDFQERYKDSIEKEEART